VEVENGRGMPAARVMLRNDGQVWVRAGDGEWPLAPYAPGERLTVGMELDCAEQTVRVALNGQSLKTYPLMCPVLSVERLTLRTGPTRLAPSPEDNLKQICSPDMEDGWKRLPEAVFRVFKVEIH
jgi:hypothetical protein